MLGQFYRIDGDILERSYKEHLSGFREWVEMEHADKYLVFPENFGPQMSIDETSTKDGELFTILSNKEGHGRKGSIAVMVRGTKRVDVVNAIMLVPKETRRKVKEVTLDFSSGMAVIVEEAFPWAMRVLDRFHMQRMVVDAVNELRTKHKREAMKEDVDARKAHALSEKKRIAHALRCSKRYYETHPGPFKRPYKPVELSNGDTVPELLERSSKLLATSPDKWSEKQKERVKILFEMYPDIKDAYALSHGLRVIFNNRKATKRTAKASLDEWCKKAAKFNASFKVIASTFETRQEDLLNYFINRSTNASAESLNTKIKVFRSQLRGIVDLKFFLFRLTKIYA